jgi:hypothetical protein
MKTIATFSFRRVLLLMQKTLAENAKFVGSGLLSIFAVYSIVIFLDVINSGNSWMFMDVFYVLGFLFGGFFVSGMAFSKLRTKEKSISFLTLPASVFEKFISELILTTLGFILLYTSIFLIFNALIYWIAPESNPAGFVDLTNPRMLEIFKIYIIIQSIFLVGAATFRRVPLFYTGFAIFVVSLSLIFFGAMLFFYLQDFGGENEGFDAGKHYFESTFWKSMLFTIPKFIFYNLLAPIFWATAYYKIKEKEV